MRKGIDISSFQTMHIDFDKVREAGIDFVIVRAGFGDKISTAFKQQLEAAQKAHLDTGAYWYSYAETVEEAIQEAEKCLEAVKGYRLNYPVWFDQEYNSPVGRLNVYQGRQLRTNICRAFMDHLERAGYYTGLYSSKDWLEHWVDGSQLTAYDKWLAQYSNHPTYTGQFGMWQYTGSGTVDGVPTAVDMDIAYKDYPKIIMHAGLNGYHSK